MIRIVDKEDKRKKITHYSSISVFLLDKHVAPSEHPMFYIRKSTRKSSAKKCLTEVSTSDFYTIMLRKLKSGVISYGRTKYDFDNGTLLFFKPGQSFSFQDVKAEQEGYTIIIHKDFISRTSLGATIKNYSFFDYAVNEALHLSPTEEGRIVNLCQNIEGEYYNNQDQFSKGIILSHLETLLKYSDRFYQRQFINRKDLNTNLYTRFNEALMNYSELNLFESNGVPTIAWIAEQLSVTPRYLSDTIKTETGKTAVEQINLYLIDVAKNLLLNPNASISETAYQLGFEYPPYFSRLFKKKVGMSPKAYIENAALN